MPRNPDQHSASPTPPPLDPDAFDVGSTEDSLPRLAAAAARSGDLFRIHAPGRRSDTWILNNPADIKRVLVTNHRNYTKGVGLDRVRILLGDGIMTSEGDLWRRQRRMIQPFFHRRVIESFAEIIEVEVERRMALWESAAQTGSPISITSEMSEMTLEIILRAIFGVDLEWLTERMGQNPFALVTEHAARDLQFAYRFRGLVRLVGELVHRRRSEGLERHDFLGMLMAARDKETGAPMPDRELLDEAMTLIVAGHETSASALNWTWYLLATHPEADAQVAQELAHLDPTARLSYADAESLRHTQAAILEAMRLYPPGWILSRRAIADDVLSGHRITAGTDLMLSPYLIQRHAAHWDSPESYRPERFLLDDPRDRWIYIPFAAGPRHCVGENFAMYEMTVHVARVAARWRMEYLDDGPLDIEAAINLRTRGDLRMRLHPR
jgi:cytochrome P450